MNTLAALLARIEYLAAENRDLYRKIETYRQDYIARNKPRKRAVVNVKRDVK